MTDPNTSLNERRGFLARMVAIVGGGAAVLAPAAIGTVAFLNPLRQKGQAGDFFKLATLEVLPEDGTPMRFPIVVKERIDAWSHYPNEAIGAVYLRRVKEGEKFKIEALQAICPHAGCPIMHEPGENGGKFLCPCHTASFDLAGTRTDPTSPSPRDMDTLEAEIRDNNEVWVKFQMFATGTSEKKAQA